MLSPRATNAIARGVASRGAKTARAYAGPTAANSVTRWVTGRRAYAGRTTEATPHTIAGGVTRWGTYTGGAEAAKIALTCFIRLLTTEVAFAATVDAVATGSIAETGRAITRRVTCGTTRSATIATAETTIASRAIA